MLYLRSKEGVSPQASPLPSNIVRLCATVPLIAYPAGCIIRLMAQEDGWLAAIIGFGLILLALICAAIIVPSYYQRIVGEEKDKLDEFEMDLRRRAYTAAYQGFSALTLVFVMYFGIASDAQDKLAWIWLPNTFDHWNAIFWGGLLYAMLLPTAWIAWTVRAPVADEE